MTDLKIELSDGKMIHGILREEISANKPMVIFVHGLTDCPENLAIYGCAKFLFDRGFTTLSLYMYDFPKEYRDLYDTTLDDNVRDFNEVVSYLRAKNVKKVFAVGHSYGGMAIIKSSADIDKAVLWDPSHGLAYKDHEDDEEYPEMYTEKFVLSVKGPGYVYPRSVKTYNDALGDNSEWAKSLLCPTKFICAEKGILIETSIKYSKQIKQKTELCVIKGASHNFDDSDKVMDELYQETLNWLENK